MNTRRLLRLIPVAGLAGALAMVAAPSGAGLPPDVRVIDSQASAAAVGLLTRVPAESDGGAVYSSTALTLDKSVARAAGFTAGPLAETFLVSSSEQYRNPVLVTAQFPPTETTPAEATVDGAATPEGAPAVGKAGRLHAKATDTPAAIAEATGADATMADVSVGSAVSTSDGELLADGTLVTRAKAVASGVRIAEVLSLASVTTVAEARVPRSGEPTTTLQVTMAGVTLAGVPAQVTPSGIKVSDQAPVSPVSLAQFNAALAQLEAQGITVVAAPLLEETAAGAARARGGAVVVRYKVADQIGGDEELTLAPASASSAVSRRATEAPAIETPELPVEATPGDGAASAPGSGLVSTPADLPPLTTGPSSFDTGSLPFDGSPAYGESSTDPSSSGPSSTDPSTGTAAAAPDSIPPSTDDLLLAAGRSGDPAQRLRTGYAAVLLALVGGVGAVSVLFRTRPA